MRNQVGRSISLAVAGLLVAAACGGTGGGATPAPSTGASGGSAALVAPTKPVEFVISTAPGGGSDIYARKMQSIIDTLKLSPQPVATVNNPSEGKSLYGGTPRKLRPLCTFEPASPTSGPFSGLATCTSQGLAISDYYIMRAIMAAPGLSAGQQAFWVDVFKKVFDSPDWKQFMTDNNLNPDFRSGADFQKLVNDYQKLHED